MESLLGVTDGGLGRISGAEPAVAPASLSALLIYLAPIVDNQKRFSAEVVITEYPLLRLFFGKKYPVLTKIFSEFESHFWTH